MKYQKAVFGTFSVLLWVSAFIYSCKDDGEVIEPEFKPTPYVFPQIPEFPTILNIPEDNPTTEEGVNLGRYLFYDGRLSGRTHHDSLMSCATCHIQAKGFEAGIDHPKFQNGHPVGIPDQEYPNGKPTPHAVMPVVNLVFNHNGYFWNGLINNNNTQLGSTDYGVPALPQYHMKNIESVVWMAIVAQHELNGDIDKTVETIASIPLYKPLFEAAFGDEEVTYDRIGKAIAQFVRTIIAYRSKFHKSLRGEASLTEAEMRGFDLFFSEEADCFHCHGGSSLMTTNLFYNNAKDTVFTDPSDRFAVTGDPTDVGAYKAPSLINAEITAPYMHDGRFKTLEEVIDFYSEGLVYSDPVHPLMKQVHSGGVQLTEAEKEDLIAFLETLTDHELLTDPQYARPADLNF